MMAMVSVAEMGLLKKIIGSLREMMSDWRRFRRHHPHDAEDQRHGRVIQLVQ